LVRELRTKTAPATATVSGGEISSRATIRCSAEGGQQGVGVDRGDQRRLDLLERRGQGVRLTAVGKLEHRDARPLLRPLARQLDGAIARAVVGDEDPQLPGVVLFGDVVERLLDRRLLVEAGDHHRQRREGEIEPQRRRTVDQDRESLR
jgi:hypothetical protein